MLQIPYILYIAEKIYFPLISNSNGEIRGESIIEITHCPLRALQTCKTKSSSQWFIYLCYNAFVFESKENLYQF